MSKLDYTIVFTALSLSALACSPSSSPSPSPGSADQEVNVGGAGSCSAEPPIAAFCAPCDSGYRIEDGAPTCTCCDAPATPPGDACCDPDKKPAQASPEGAYCCADGTWQESLGGGVESTCQATGHGGAGNVCAEPAEVCGDAPVNAFCAPCAAGLGYKQVDGQPTCQCCGE